MASNMAHACGFTISGVMLTPGFVDNSLQFTAPAAYDAHGGTHLRYVDQGMYIDVYRTGGNEYLSMDGPSYNVVPQWRAFGVTSGSVIRAAGTTRWVRLTQAERKIFDNAVDGAGRIGSPVALGESLASGFGQPWHLHGVTVYRGVRCVVLTQSWVMFGQPGSTTIYVGIASGLPVAAVYGAASVVITFGNWGHVAVIAAPPSSRVVAG
jgi:hypothetical protein